MDERPNILLIMADQLRWDYIGAYGKNSWINTPNIDSLAKEGCLFTNAYSPNPVCIPARHNLITGLPARFHGFDDNYFGPFAKNCPSSLPTFAEVLSNAGYNTAAIGKMHFQPERRSTGFDIFLNQDEVVKDISEDEYAQFLIDKGFGNVGSIHGVRNILYMQPQESLLPEEYHGSCWVADRTIEYIRSRKTRKKPFLLWTGFIHPHPPLALPPSWSHLYDGKVPLPVETKTPVSQIAEENKYNAFFPNISVLQRWRELYACAVSFMDWNVGRILKTLEEENLKENTLVIFVSDHGEMLGDNGTYQKMLPYDGSAKIPFIVRWPKKIEKGTVRKEFVDLNDILPTFIHLGEGKYDYGQDLPGESLFSKNPTKDRSFQYIEHQHGSKRWCALICEKYKYVHFYGDRDELYDRINDPDETTNLLYGKDVSYYEPIISEMKKKLISLEDKWGLPGHIDNGDFLKFPPYVAQNRRERIFPFSMVRDPDSPRLSPISDEILKAIKNEPLVKIENLKPEEVLLQQGGFTEKEFKELMEKAKKQGN